MLNIRFNQLLDQSEPKNLAPKPKLALYLLFVIVVIGGVHWSLTRSQANWSTSKTPGLWYNLKNFLWGKNLLAGEKEDRINVLLLGMGGRGHDGPFLTDSIILASLKPSSGQVALLSIPRDLWINIPEVGYRRINEANAIGEKVEEHGGAKLAQETVSNLLNLDIPYYVRVDFRGFAKAIDDLGGVTMTVEQSFVDDTYPTDDYKTQTIAFEAGTQHFSGDEALKFVRSRHGSNGEGSDFARSRRQTQLLLALKDKVLSRSLLLNPNQILSALSRLSDHFSTNLAPWQLVRLGRLSTKISRQEVRTVVLDASPSGYLQELLLTDGAMVLSPKDSSLADIRELSAQLLNSQVTNSPSENARLIIQNGTGINGLALATAEWLKDQGFVIVRYGNAENRGATETLIYDLTGGKKMQALKLLEEKLPGKLSTPPPALSEAVDFLIILGPPPPEHPLAIKERTT